VSNQFAQAGRPQARCRLCDSDLLVRLRKNKAFVYCSNDECKHSTYRHPTGATPNAGMAQDD
jgi:ssDNA-binding Zn-finger/Zn-ribbon topoisomerase 1